MSQRINIQWINIKCKKIFNTIVITGLFWASSGCEIHRLDIQQGNILTAEAIKQLKPGMNKKQVLFLLGTPLVENIFDPHRWDYVYTMKTRHDSKYERLTLYFKEDALVKMEGNLAPQQPFN